VSDGKTTYEKCPECGSKNAKPSAAVPGMLACPHCGNLWVSSKPVYAKKEDVPEKGRLHAHQTEIMAALPELQMPDEIEVEYGWRAWKVKRTVAPGEVPILHSATYGATWAVREPTVAICDRSTGRANGVQREGHEVPDEDCTCGLYSAKTLRHLQSMGYHGYSQVGDQIAIIGRLKLWGKVIEGTQGWRAEKGYPAELYVPFEAWHLAEPLETAYGVPVALMNTLGEKLSKKEA
jgi:hypothetical protein